MKISLTLLTLSFSFVIFSQDWEEKASLPAAAIERHHPITFTIGGVAYLVTGAKPGAGVLKDFYSYDMDTDTWSTLPDFPGQARGFSYGVSTNEKGYLGFGLYENEDTFEYFSLNDFWSYEPISGEWTELTPCPCISRWHPAMVQVNNKIYVGLGGSEFGDLKDWWEYDIETDTWTEKEEFPGTERHHPYYFGIGDDVYVGFGHHNSFIFNDFYRYNPATDSWTELGTFPEQGRVAGTQFSYDGKGYILSGQGETHTNLPTGEFWEYDPSDDSWTELLAHPGAGRWAPGSFVIDGFAFFTCGEANAGEQKDLISFALTPSANIEEITSELEIYPNPTHGKIYFKSDEKWNNATVEILDATGKLVDQTTILNQTINLEKLQKGVYLLRIKGNNTVRVERVTVH
ncbi:kelch repeat-containing protein [Crocinitomix algicola]|uniref:kelch repeat-containing protein n=1 Tax=Crocinitomix algicola TaxID=1740263 RepID=UPI000871DD82|nr:kelch repeat-containing protein [Crocinitomix algicola]